MAKLFKGTAAQETEHAFDHFSLLHPELVVKEPATLSDAQKQDNCSSLPRLVVEGETDGCTTMHPDFAADVVRDRDSVAVVEFEAQESADRVLCSSPESDCDRASRQSIQIIN